MIYENTFLDPKLGRKWEPDPDPKKFCGSGIGSGSARIQNFLQDPDTDSELKVMDPAQDPELNLNLIRHHQNY
jgi:hypothetical protein